MTTPPAGGAEGALRPRITIDVPGPLSDQLHAASITEFAYLTPRGEPLCWPVTPYWYPDRGVLGVSTGGCTVMGCGAPVIPVVGLAFVGLSSGTLALLAELSRFATILVFVAVLTAAFAYAWRKGVFEWR